MPKHFTAILIALSLALAPFLGGCSQPASDAPDTESASSESAQNNPGTPQVDVATQPNTLPEKDATAKEVCQRFLGLLAQNERNLAEQLLTRQALKVTVDAGLELEAMGGNGSSVEVGDALYATSRAKVAQVPCTITESTGDSQSLIWMMRRSESGWRIAGLVVNPGKAQELLSFENRTDVAAIMGAKATSVAISAEPDDLKAEANPSEPAEIRLISGTDDE